MVRVKASGRHAMAPGPYACSAIIQREGMPVARYMRYLGDAGTVNLAEYGGLILALEQAIILGVTDITIRMDSELVVNQVLGMYQTKQPALRVLRDQAIKLAHQIPSVHIDHVPRECNSEADRLVTDLLDQKVGKKRGLK